MISLEPGRKPHCECVNGSQRESNCECNHCLGRCVCSNEKPVDKQRFICIYPAYINSKKTLAEGRRIPTEKAVENPTVVEIRDVLTAAGLNVELEQNKMYPREWNRDATFKGRVRVQLKKDDGNLCLEKFRSRKDVMVYVAETIPKLKSRNQKSGAGDSGAQPGEGSKKSKKKRK